MPADFFLVTDKIMRKNPHRKRYGTSSKNTKTSAPDLGTEVFSTYVCFVFVNVRRQVLQECRAFALLLLVVIDVHVATATNIYLYILVPASSGFSELRARVHRRLSTSFRQISLHTALKILAIRKYACKFLPCLQKNLLENPHIFPTNTSSYLVPKIRSPASPRPGTM